jgi:CheY-like chemotaxis protein
MTDFLLISSVFVSDVGHICEEAEDGFDAVQKVIEKSNCASGRRNYDAILMDFIMPNMDGPTATREIRALGYTAPIFGVTGNGLTTDIAHFLMCGVDEVLLKPLNIIDFYIAMKKSNLM